MKLHEKLSNASKFLTAEEVLVKHPMATRTWFIDSRRRSRKASKMNPKQVMELCDWFEKDGQLFCQSKKTGKQLVWDEPRMVWTNVSE
jgi:hypothetical protein